MVDSLIYDNRNTLFGGVNASSARARTPIFYI